MRRRKRRHSGRSVRSLHRRLGYCRKDGQWLKSDTVTYDVPAKTGLFDAYVESYDRRIQSAINIQGKKMQRRAEFLLKRALRQAG